MYQVSIRTYHMYSFRPRNITSMTCSCGKCFQEVFLCGDFLSDTRVSWLSFMIRSSNACTAGKNSLLQLWY